jgi:hypothetical protein
MCNVLELTCNNTTLQITDPKDCIHAILKLLALDDGAEITANPGATCEDLYIQATLRYRTCGVMLAKQVPSDLMAKKSKTLSTSLIRSLNSEETG